MHYVQSNIDLISTWISSHYLTINSLKTKYMIISRKSPTFLASLPPLCLNKSQLDLVTSFKYLGIIISSNLSWSLHIQSICSKARQIIGVIYRSFYQHASPQTLFTLYRSLVLSHLTYCSSVWDPPKNSFHSTLLEKTQLFAIRMCSHNWSSDYYSLLSSHNISPLSTCHSISKLCLVYKISNKLIYFPSDCFVPKPLHTHSSRHYDGLMYSVPFSCTSAFKNSFVPSALSLWNPLPYHINPLLHLQSLNTM